MPDKVRTHSVQYFPIVPPALIWTLFPLRFFINRSRVALSRPTHAIALCRRWTHIFLGESTFAGEIRGIRCFPWNAFYVDARINTCKQPCRPVERPGGSLNRRFACFVSMKMQRRARILGHWLLPEDRGHDCLKLNAMRILPINFKRTRR